LGVADYLCEEEGGCTNLFVEKICLRSLERRSGFSDSILSLITCGAFTLTLKLFTTWFNSSFKENALLWLPTLD
jgi:hypothetical protein